MMLPQRPYFPIGSLQAAIVYPAEADAFSPERVREAVTAVGLPAARARGWTRRRTGTGCCRSANSSASGSPARCCTRRNICSSMRRPPRSTNLGGRALPADRAEIAGDHHRLDRPPLARWRPSTSAMWCWAATATGLRCRTAARTSVRHSTAGPPQGLQPGCEAPSGAEHRRPPRGSGQAFHAPAKKGAADRSAAPSV